jgi:hypothetical protein
MACVCEKKCEGEKTGARLKVCWGACVNALCMGAQHWALKISSFQGEIFEMARKSRRASLNIVPVAILHHGAHIVPLVATHQKLPSLP